MSTTLLRARLCRITPERKYHATRCASPPSSQLGYKVSDRLQVGIESHNEFGEVRHLDKPFRQGRTTCAVVDTTLSGWDLNLGVGRGSVAASDHWVLKAIVGVPFN